MHLGRRYDGQLHTYSSSLTTRAEKDTGDGEKDTGDGPKSDVAVAVRPIIIPPSRYLPLLTDYRSQVASLVAGLLAVIFILYIILRMLRSAGYEPRFIPTQYLKRKWKNWTPKRSYDQVPHETRLNNTSSAGGVGGGQDTAYTGRGGNGNGGEEMDNATAAAVGIDRNTSVRSVMTLPAYSPNPKASEQIIGREGERAGMDSVVEFPETVDEEEARREEQMESLYQIRLARRIEQEEREERRRQRREARSRSDWDRLNDLRRERRARANSQATGGSSLSVNDGGRVSAAALVAEHQSRGRERRVAAVTYAEVGHVRHDGTRLRASSQDSDSRPLLDAAASMGGGRDSPSYTPASRSRGNSAASSVMSASTANSDFDQPSTSNISNSNPIPHTHPNHLDDITPRNSTDVADPSSSSIPPPPDYEALTWGDAPAYESPVVGQGEQREFPPTSSEEPQQQTPRIELELPNLTVLPSIEIEGATPANSAPNTPATPTMRAAAEEDSEGATEVPTTTTRPS
ncbi:hypothetical protein FQN54_001826 [Arachnomyces sp. PD_36]|nr:hypothetical protein FQN54_001826 [Arachnomyces sp. PD_36]